MGQRNNGQGEANALQNRFTAYLLTAVRRQKYTYDKKRARLRTHEISVDCSADEPIDAEDFDMIMNSLPLMMQLEDTALMQAISGLTPKERCILFERVLNERSYDELGKTLGLRYSGIAAVYRRIIEKLRKELRGEG